MIKIKNYGDFILDFALPVTQTNGNAAVPGSGNSVSAIVPFNGRISALFARLKTAGTTGVQGVDILQNGASITAAKTVFGFASATVVANYNTGAITTTVGNPVLVNKGDVISILNRTVHTGTAAQDLSVYITLERQRSGAFNDVIQTDTVGADSDMI